MGIVSRRTLLCVILVIVAGQSRAHPLAAAHSVIANSVRGQLPDSIRTRIFAALAAGNVEGAVAAYMAHRGLTVAPRWLQALQSAFSVASRQMGRCQEVARAIHEAFTKFGARPEYVKVVVNNVENVDRVNYLTWRGRLIMSDNNFHVAVRYGGRIYDAFTGAAGMIEREYLATIQTHGTLSIIVTEVP